MKIIGIGGKINSGKDTVGEIIRYLIECDVNKSSLNKPSKFLENTKYVKSNWKIKKFAKKVKEVASLLTGIDVENFENRGFKDSLLGKEWGTVKSNVLNSVTPFNNVEFNELISVRELLQKIGTDCLRNNLHKNVWVNALFNNVSKDRNIIITDVRFLNEMESIKNRNGITIRINKHFKEESLTENIFLKKTEEHPSEKELDNETFDYTINNNKTIKKLINKVKKILIIEGIINR